MTTVLTNAAYAQQAAALAAEFSAGSINQASYQSQLTDLLNAWSIQSPAQFASQIADMIASNEALKTSLNALPIRGAVATSSALPTSANDGDLWIAQDTGAGYAWLATSGIWLYVGAVRGPAGSTVLSLVWSINNAPMAGERLPQLLIDTALTLNAARSGARAAMAFTASATFTITRNGASIGTVVFAPGAQTGAISLTSTSLSAGDLIRIVCPSPADVTGADLVITLSGDR